MWGCFITLETNSAELATLGSSLMKSGVSSYSPLRGEWICMSVY
jgi:hypothetical protein